METKWIVTDPENPEAYIIEQAASILHDGGLVAFPTETVYGLGADALNAEGAKRIYAAKGRPSDNPLIVHVADMDAVQRIAEVSEQARLLMERFWPGPLTMVLKKKDCVPYATTGGLDTVAVRMPNHAAALALIRAGGGYIAAPSANTSGRPSPTRAEHVYEDMQGRIPMILDAGPVGIGLESTIVDLTGQMPMILRPGYITKEMLQAVIGGVADDPGLTSQDDSIRPKAPGMKYRHYAPKAELLIIEGKKENVIRWINAQLLEEEEKLCAVICTDETRTRYHTGVVKSVGSRTDEDEIARNLYGVLRDMDALQVDIIYTESLQTPRIGQAIMNRLLKAAGYKTIQV